MARAGLSVLVAVLLMAPAVAWLASRGGAASDVDPARFVMPEHCRPEAGERTAFLFGALGLPALIFTAAWAARGFEVSARAEAAAGLAILAAVVALGVAVLRWEPEFFLFESLLRGPTAAIGAAAGLVAWGRRGGAALRRVAEAAAWAAIVALALARVFGEASHEADRSHFEPPYHATIQVALGKTILVDAASQYGLYPHALAPIVSAFGLGVLPFTATMATLTAAALAGAWAFLRGATANRGVALVGFLAVAASGSYTLLMPGVHDPYFQYMPIRVVFPIASLCLSWRYARRPSRRGYAATMAALGVGPLWNLDAGLPALAAWVGMLGYLELATPGRRPSARLLRIAGHAAAGVTAFGMALLGYAAFALARSGRAPDFTGFTAYQAIFYRSGFYMLPMPRLGGWCLVAAVYLAALALAARAVVDGRATPRSAIAFHLAALGIGLSSYYQGRSHPTVLALACWPALILTALFLDDLMTGLGRADLRAPRLAWAAALAATLAGPAWSLVGASAALPGWYGDHLLGGARPSPLAPEIAMLRENVRPGERVLMISRHESQLCAALRAPSAWRSSLVEALLVDDFRAMADRIGRGEFDWLYLDDSALDHPFRMNLGLPELAPAFNRGATAGTTAHGRLVRPGRGAASLLGPATAPFHARFDDDFAGLRPDGPPVATGPRFTIEAVVRPDADQVAGATIFGNLPGRPPCLSGFSLQLAGPSGEDYALFLGDGRGFAPLAVLRLEPGRWAYVAIAVGDGRCSTYLDGRMIATRAIPDPVPIAPSPLPVVVGDWFARDRPFRGRIAEARVVEGALGPEQVARNWSSASRALEALAGREAVRR